MSHPIVKTMRPQSVSLMFACWYASLNRVDPHKQTIVGRK
jgi:hypothetical protein